ncbi:hypothetical protein D3C72_1814070 [compost metagenome]
MAGHGTTEGFEAWLSARGHTLPAAAPSPAILLQRADDYLDAVYGARLANAEPSAALTLALERATYAAAWQEAQSPGSLSASATTAGAVKREKVGSLEVEYIEGSGDVLADATVRLSAVEGLLAPFFTVAMPAVFVL